MARRPKEQSVPWYKQEISIGGVKVVDLAMMSKHLSVMLSAGLTVPDALDVMTDQSSGILRKVLTRVNRRVQGGMSFGDALEKEKKTFKASFISAVRVGEDSGTLDANLTRLAEQMERDLRLRRNIQSALLYPVTVLVLAVILGFGVAIYVLPDIADIFESLRVELPWTTRALIWVARFFEEYGLVVALATFGFAVFSFWGVRQPVVKPIVDRAVLRIPVFGEFLHLVNRARFARTLGTLLESGTPIQEALEITYSAMQNQLYVNSVGKMITEVSAGSEFAGVIGEYPYLYPKLIQRMVAVGEQSASLGTTLSYLADFYEERVLVMSKNMSSLLEPFLLIMMGIMVGGLAISVLTPIYSVLTAVGA